LLASNDDSGSGFEEKVREQEEEESISPLSDPRYSRLDHGIPSFAQLQNSILPSNASELDHITY